MDAQLMQTLAAAGIVAGAALYLGRRVLARVGAMRRSGKEDGCDGGCCGPK